MNTPNPDASYERSSETATVAEIANLVAQHRIDQTPLFDLPERLQPQNYDSVEAIMLAIQRRLPWETGGWKVGAASLEVQKLERMPGPVPGRLYRRRFYPSGARIARSDFINHRNTECEFAFILDHDLPARDEPYTAAELSYAVGEFVSVLEIGDSVFPNWYEDSRYYGPCLDNGGGAAIVLGEKTRAWRDVDLAEAGIDRYVNGELRRQGKGSAAMGHLLRSLAWLASWTSRHGIDLNAGELLSSGTCTGHYFANPGDEVGADFGPFGEISVTYLEGGASA